MRNNSTIHSTKFYQSQNELDTEQYSVMFIWNGRIKCASGGQTQNVLQKPIYVMNDRYSGYLEYVLTGRRLLTFFDEEIQMHMNVWVQLLHSCWFFCRCIAADGRRTNKNKSMFSSMINNIFDFRMYKIRNFMRFQITFVYFRFSRRYHIISFSVAQSNHSFVFCTFVSLLLIVVNDIDWPFHFFFCDLWNCNNVQVVLSGNNDRMA